MKVEYSSINLKTVLYNLQWCNYEQSYFIKVIVVFQIFIFGTKILNYFLDLIIIYFFKVI